MHDGDTNLSLHGPEVLAKRGTQLSVYGSKRVVEYQDPRADHERTGQSHPLLLFTRKLGGTPPRVFRHLDGGECGAHPDRCLRATASCPGAGMAQPERHICGDIEEGKQGIAAEYRTDCVTVRGRAARILAVDENLAG